MGSYVLLPDGFIMLLLCHLGAYTLLWPLQLRQQRLLTRDLYLRSPT